MGTKKCRKCAASCRLNEFRRDKVINMFYNMQIILAFFIISRIFAPLLTIKLFIYEESICMCFYSTFNDILL